MLGNKPRVENRTKVMVRASLRDGGPEREICILDVSTRGLLATTARPPKFGEFVEVNVYNKSLIGHVKWSSNRRFGVVLQDRISVISFLNGGAGSMQLPKKRRMATVARGAVATYDDSRRTAQLAQLAVLVAFTGLAAIVIANLIGVTFGNINLTGS